MKNLVFLIGGIVIALAFVLCSTTIYEWFYISQGYHNELYNRSMYTWFALITVVVAWGAAGIYYYAIDSVKFDRWWHWLIVFACVMLLTGGICWAYNSHVFADAGLVFPAEMAQFALQSMLFGGIMFVIASFAIRWWSVNCRHTPIPQ